MDITLDGVANFLVAIGAGGIIIFFLREYRRVRLANNKTEAVIPLEVRGSAATTFAAEMIEARKSFDADRALKDNTILDMSRRIQFVEAERDAAENRAREERSLREAQERELDAVKGKLREAMLQIQELLDTVELMSEKMATRRREKEDHDDTDESAFSAGRDSLHPGPGA